MFHNPGGDWNPGQGGQPQLIPLGDLNKKIPGSLLKFAPAHVAPPLVKSWVVMVLLGSLDGHDSNLS